jgi:hypothetical protein
MAMKVCAGKGKAGEIILFGFQPCRSSSAGLQRQEHFDAVGVWAACLSPWGLFDDA